MNDLIPWINPIVTVNNNLTNEEVHHAFVRSINSKWELEAKNSGFTNDRIRFFNFVKTKHIEKLGLDKKRKRSDQQHKNENNGKHNRNRCNSNNSQGSQFNYDQNSQFSHGSSNHSSLCGNSNHRRNRVGLFHRGGGRHNKNNFQQKSFSEEGNNRGAGGGHRGRHRGGHNQDSYRGGHNQGDRRGFIQNSKSQPYHYSTKEFDMIARHDDVLSAS